VDDIYDEVEDEIEEEEGGLKNGERAENGSLVKEGVDEIDLHAALALEEMLVMSKQMEGKYEDLLLASDKNAIDRQDEIADRQRHEATLAHARCVLDRLSSRTDAALKATDCDAENNNACAEADHMRAEAEKWISQFQIAWFDEGEEKKKEKEKVDFREGEDDEEKYNRLCGRLEATLDACIRNIGNDWENRLERYLCPEVGGGNDRIPDLDPDLETLTDVLGLMRGKESAIQARKAIAFYSELRNRVDRRTSDKASELVHGQGESDGEGHGVDDNAGSDEEAADKDAEDLITCEEEDLILYVTATRIGKGWSDRLTSYGGFCGINSDLEKNDPWMDKFLSCLGLVRNRSTLTDLHQAVASCCETVDRVSPGKLDHERRCIAICSAVRRIGGDWKARLAHFLIRPQSKDEGNADLFRLAYLLGGTIVGGHPSPQALENVLDSCKEVHKKKTQHNVEKEREKDFERNDERMEKEDEVGSADAEIKVKPRLRRRVGSEVLESMRQQLAAQYAYAAQQSREGNDEDRDNDSIFTPEGEAARPHKQKEAMARIRAAFRTKGTSQEEETEGETQGRKGGNGGFAALQQEQERSVEGEATGIVERMKEVEGEQALCVATCRLGENWIDSVRTYMDGIDAENGVTGVRMEDVLRLLNLIRSKLTLDEINETLKTRKMRLSRAR
jgi:hypothetical protein